MREITDHVVNPANDRLKIVVKDEPGAGGANHRYEIRGENEAGDGFSSYLYFQNGPINENGVNGLTHEALLAIICDRLRAFQRGPFACRENALALTKIEEAQHWLLHRTKERTKERTTRGVEGTHQK